MPERDRPADRPSADRRGRYVMRPEWLRTDAAVSGGALIIGVYLVQTLVAIGSEDLAARIAIVAWAIALPLLAALLLLNFHQQSQRYASFPIYFSVLKAIAQLSAGTGLAASFWHASLPAGVIFIIASLIALAFYAAYLRRIYRDNRPE